MIKKSLKRIFAILDNDSEAYITAEKHRKHKIILRILSFAMPLLFLLWRAHGIDNFLTNPDHGTQLAWGKQILLGKFPFRDLLIPVGPLTAFISAFGLWISDSLLPEIVICALGYSSAIFIVADLTRKLISPKASIFALFAGLVLLARFYKWYYWLFPLLCLYLVHCFMFEPNRRKWAILLGGCIAIAGLFRFELGLACLFATGISWILFSRYSKSLSFCEIGFLFAGAIPLFAIWIIILALFAGWEGIYNYFVFPIDSLKSLVNVMSLPFPDFDYANPFSRTSACFISLIITPISYLACLCYGFIRASKISDKNSKIRMLTFAGIGIFGFSVFPQTLHRIDTAHLMQVIPPMIIASIVLIAEFWNRMSKYIRKPCNRCLLKVILVCYAFFLSGLMIINRSHGDFAPLNSNPVARYSDLIKGISSKPDHPYTKLVLAVRENTRESDIVLVLPRNNEYHPTQLYYLLDRKMAGLYYVYYRGLFSEKNWRIKNYNAIKNNPPVVIITGIGYQHYSQFHTELYKFVKSNYTETVYSKDSWVVKRKP